jgi:hypothetical protein
LERQLEDIFLNSESFKERVQYTLENLENEHRALEARLKPLEAESNRIKEDITLTYHGTMRTNGKNLYFDLIGHEHPEELKLIYNEPLEREINALKFYADKEVNIADRVPQLEELIHRARMGE